MDHTVVRVGANVVCTAIDTPLCISGCGRVLVLALVSYFSVMSEFWIVGGIANE